MIMSNKPLVALARCERYDVDAIKGILAEHFSVLGIDLRAFRGKKILIKPNLVMKKSPDGAATTHPAAIEALIRLLKEAGCEDICLADSPGGQYVEARLRSVYRESGMEDLCERTGIRLNYDTTFLEVSNPEGSFSKSFNLIRPVYEAEVIFDFCKLKSHSLTRLSGAVKNLFGCVPGIQKFEMHARFDNVTEFSAMLTDLCSCVMRGREFVAICDAIYGMEGNGPTAGEPKYIGALLTSKNPFALDVVGAWMIGAEGVDTVLKGAELGYCPATLDEIEVLGEDPATLKPAEFKQPEGCEKKFLNNFSNILGGRLVKFFQPHPEINRRRCVGCGECVRSCPVKTIQLKEKKNGRKVAKIEHLTCIRCYCCQELCPFKAVKIKKNPIITLLH